VTLTIDHTSMSSDQPGHTAAHLPDRGGWEVSWLPGQILDRNPAITAMVLADTSANATCTRDTGSGHSSRAGQQNSGLTAPDAIARLPSRPAKSTASSTSRPAARPRGDRLSSNTPHPDKQDSPRRQTAPCPSPPRNLMKHRVTHA